MSAFRSEYANNDDIELVYKVWSLALFIILNQQQQLKEADLLVQRPY